MSEPAQAPARATTLLSDPVQMSGYHTNSRTEDADGDMQHHHATLVAAARTPPSRATLERIAKRVAASKPPVSRKKPYVRAVPAPMDVNFRMAYVGTRRVIAGGALVDGGILERWEEAIDRYHLLERLKQATGIVCPDRQERERIFGPLIASLDNDDVAIDKIEHRLIKHAKDLKRKDEAVLLEHLTYIENNKDRMRYVGLRLAHLPVVSGVTESTAKVAVKQRANRSGQRWSEHGLRGLLTLRALKLGDRFHAVWKCFAEGYVTPVTQAA